MIYFFLQCMGCPYGGLDFTSGLFIFFGPESLGVLTGSWVFGGAASPSPTPTPTPQWTSTYQPPPPSSTSSVIHYTTSNFTSTISSTSSLTSTQSSASVSSTPTPLVPSPEAGNIAGLFLSFVQVESILALAHLD